jgi:hypothetical protein
MSNNTEFIPLKQLYSADEESNKIETLKRYHPPNHIHAILALHCEYQNINIINTGPINSSDVQKNILKCLKNTENINIIKKEIGLWFVIDFFPKKTQTPFFESVVNAYCGFHNQNSQDLETIIYQHHISKQIIVASKNEINNKSYYSNVNDFIANDKYKDVAISFTGYDRGGEKAVSNLIDCQLNNFCNVRAIIFNSPDINKLIADKLESLTSYLDITDLDITQYPYNRDIAENSNDFKSILPKIIAEITENQENKNSSFRTVSDKIDRFILLALIDSNSNEQTIKIDNFIKENCETINLRINLKSSNFSFDDIRDKVRHLISNGLNIKGELKIRMKNLKLFFSKDLITRKYNDYKIEQIKLKSYLNQIEHNFYCRQIIVLKSILIEAVHLLAIEYSNTNKQFIKCSIDGDLNECLDEFLKLNEIQENFLENTKEKPIEKFLELLEITGQCVLFIVDNVDNLNNLTDFVEKINKLNNVSLIITTSNDNLLKNHKSIYEIQFRDFDKKDQKLMVRNLNLLKSVNTKAWDCIKMLSLIQKGKLCIEDILKNHTELDFLNDGIQFLQTKSFINIDNKIATIENVLRKEACNDFGSGLKFLIYLSQIKYDYIDLNLAFKIFSKFNELEFENEVKSKNNYNEINKNNYSNLVKIINNFLSNNDKLKSDEEEHDKLKSDKDKSIRQALNTLKYSLEDDINKSLENFIEQLKKDLNKPFIGNQDYEREILNFLNELCEFKSRLDHIYINSVSSSYSKNLILVGPTRGAKSTIINGLIGNQIKCMKIGGLGGVELIEKKNEGPEIGNEICKSKTNSINEYQNKKNNIKYLDTPGLFDTNGSLHEIYNSFKITSLNQIIQQNEQKNFGLIIVISEDRLKAPPKIIDDLKKLNVMLRQNENIYDKIGLVISKREKIIDKKELIELIKKNCGTMNIFENLPNKDFEAFEKKDFEAFEDKISFFDHIKQTGDLDNNEYFSEIQILIDKKLKYGDFKLSICISEATKNDIQSIVSVFNSYAEYLIDKFKSDSITNFKSELDKNEGGFKQKIQQKYSEASASASLDKLNEFELEDYLKGSLNDSKTINSIEKLIKILSFFKQINETININILSWATSIQRLINSLTLFTAPITPEITNEEIIFKSYIIFVSEINQTIKKNKMPKSISIMSYLFIVDEDLIFSGINLNIASYFWKILEKVKISLKGIDGKNNGDQGGRGGNYFGYTPNFFINEQKHKLTIDVSGGKGGNYGNKEIINEEEKSIKKILQKDEITYSYYKRNQNILENFKSKFINQEKLKGLTMQRQEILNKIALNKKESVKILLDQNLSEQNNKLMDACFATEQKLRIELSDTNYSKLFLCIENTNQLFSDLTKNKKILEAYKNKDSYNSKIEKLAKDIRETLGSDLNEDFEKKQNKIKIELDEVIRNLKLVDEKKFSIDELKILEEKLVEQENNYNIEKDKYENGKFEVINYDLIRNPFPDLKEVYRQKEITANELNSITNKLKVNIENTKEIINQFEKLGQSFKNFVQAHIEYDEKKKRIRRI